MVVISLPSTVETGVWQERVGCPATWTVQALHWPTPHPYLVPVRSRVSLRTQRRGVSGETSTEVGFPLTRKDTGMGGPAPREVGLEGRISECPALGQRS